MQHLKINRNTEYFTDKTRIQDLSEQVHDLKHQHIPNHIKGTMTRLQKDQYQSFYKSNENFIIR